MIKKRLSIVVILGMIITSCNESKKNDLKKWVVSFSEFNAQDSSDAILEIKFQNNADTNYYIIYNVFYLSYAEEIRTRWRTMRLNAAEKYDNEELATQRYYFVSWPISSQRNCVYLVNGLSTDLCEGVKLSLKNVLEENYSMELKDIRNKISEQFNATSRKNKVVCY